MGRHAGPDGLPTRGDQVVLRPAREQGISAGRGAALLAQHLTRPTEDLDFFTAPDRGHVPAARDALEAAARKRGWTVERIHDSDTFCRLVIRSDTAEIATDLAVDTPPDFPCLYYGCRAHAGSRGTRRPQAARTIRPGRGTEQMSRPVVQLVRLLSFVKAVLS